MAHNGSNDMNGWAVYGKGSPSELSCGLTEGNNTGLKKGPWTAVEDRILMEYVSKHGEGNWNAVQRNSRLKRCGKSCRLRWANHLRPNLKKGQFTPEEERLILELHAKHGNKWARMASQLPGRTDNEIKNYWNTRVKKRLRKGLSLYPQDINPTERVCHSYSYAHSYDENTMSINPTGLKQLVTTTMPQTDTNFNFQSQNQTQFPPRPSQNQHNSYLSSHALPLYDPTTSMPSFNFHHPVQMLGTPLGCKRYQEDIGFSPPISPTPQRNSSILRTSSMPEIASYQQYATGTNFLSDFSSFQFQPQTQTTQLPSSHVSHTRSLSDINTTSYGHANVVNATHCSDGFLEQLLQEAERFGYGSHPIRKQIGRQLDSSDHEKSHVFNGYGHLPAMDTSLLEMKPTQDHEQMSSIPKYLANMFSFNSSTELVHNSNDGESTELPNSSLLEMKQTEDHDEYINAIPKYMDMFIFNLSMEAVPNSYNGESAKLPNSQPPGVTEGGLEFDMQQHMDSLFPAANSWDNLAETSVEVS